MGERGKDVLYHSGRPFVQKKGLADLATRPQRGDEKRNGSESGGWVAMECVDAAENRRRRARIVFAWCVSGGGATTADAVGLFCGLAFCAVYKGAGAACLQDGSDPRQRCTQKARISGAFFG